MIKNSEYRKYTLVLDLDETLIHYQEYYESNKKYREFLIRPFAIEFLKEMYKYYEIVIFTSALPDYADWILDSLEEKIRESEVK